MKQEPGLSYAEIRFSKEDVNFSQSKVKFKLTFISQVLAIPDASASYVLGSSAARVTVDGNTADWGSTAPLLKFPSRSIAPPDLEVSSVYVADDTENLYLRIDTRRAPATSLKGGYLSRSLYVYFDTDDDSKTGDPWHSGAELLLKAEFNVNPTRKSSTAVYYRYSGDWKMLAINDSNTGFNDAFEAKIPLSYMGAKPGQRIKIHLTWILWQFVAETPVLEYPPTTPTTEVSQPAKPTESTPNPQTPPEAQQPTQTQQPPQPSTQPATPSNSTSSLSAEALLALGVLALIVAMALLATRRRRAPPPPPPPS
ncbi:hypothetical protein [Infirmifilum sp. NZ]|uniref:hypothetical protein n=1 Tax=Infirmifilum sp. NZ TaxID=2926850 RepID=UPI0027A3951B|nr:hypothetical protein [Infirmifilum sp. NZ]UNQ73788.1 hypothetical protein MOV14_01945 [Infirmifilum sp. NZ]